MDFYYVTQHSRIEVLIDDTLDFETSQNSITEHTLSVCMCVNSDFVMLHSYTITV